jgi:hypothetical protein
MQTAQNKANVLFKELLNVFTKTEREFLMKRIQPTFWCTPSPYRQPLMTRHVHPLATGNTSLYVRVSRTCVTARPCHERNALLKAWRFFPSYKFRSQDSSVSTVTRLLAGAPISASVKRIFSSRKRSDGLAETTQALIQCVSELFSGGG